jgi:hypothetical protein
MGPRSEVQGTRERERNGKKLAAADRPRELVVDVKIKAMCQV